MHLTHTLPVIAETLMKALKGKVNEDDFYFGSLEALREDQLRVLKEAKCKDLAQYKSLFAEGILHMVDRIDSDRDMSKGAIISCMKTIGLVSLALANLQKTERPYKDYEEYNNAVFDEARRVRIDEIKVMIRKASTAPVGLRNLVQEVERVSGRTF